ncbi:hypothetical protein WA158_005741 [Blastocystis sp. Blastoise]
MSTPSTITLSDSNSKNTIQFIFQDEVKVGIPIDILELCPESILSLTYTSEDSLDNEDHSCYIDYHSYSIEKVISYLEGKLSIDCSLSITELCNMYKTFYIFCLHGAFSHYFELSNIIQQALQTFLKKNNCTICKKTISSDITEYILIIEGIISEERNKKFLEYSCLFELMNITRVHLKYHYSNEISYDTIYPSNIHELFPRLLRYDIELIYYPSTKTIKIKNGDYLYDYFSRCDYSNKRRYGGYIIDYIPNRRFPPLNINKDPIEEQKKIIKFQTEIEVVAERIKNDLTTYSKKTKKSKENIVSNSDYSFSSISDDNSISSVASNQPISANISTKENNSLNSDKMIDSLSSSINNNSQNHFSSLLKSSVSPPSPFLPPPIITNISSSFLHPHISPPSPPSHIYPHSPSSPTLLDFPLSPSSSSLLPHISPPSPPPHIDHHVSTPSLIYPHTYPPLLPSILSPPSFFSSSIVSPFIVASFFPFTSNYPFVIESDNDTYEDFHFISRYYSSNIIVQYPYYYSDTYNNHILNDNNYQDNYNVISTKKSTFYFHFKDNNDIIDYEHPILEIPIIPPDSIFTYLLNMPICKHLKEICVSDKKIFWELQIVTPPLLTSFLNDLFDLHTTINLTDLIDGSSYGHYKQFLEDYISTHIFPNVTTLRIDNRGNKSFDEKMFNRFLLLFTSEHFPKLHIYDLQHYSINNYEFVTSIDSILQIPLIEQLDTMYMTISTEQEVSLDHSKKKSYLDSILQTIKKLNNNTNYQLCLDNSTIGAIYSEDTHFLKDYEFKELYIHDKEAVIYSSVFSPNEVNSFTNIMNSLNTEHIETITFSFRENYHISLPDFVSSFKKANYPHLKKLTITYISMFAGVTLEDIKINAKNMSLLLSCFSNSLKELNLDLEPENDYMETILKETVNFPLWENIESLSFPTGRYHRVTCLFDFFCNNFINNKLLQLESLVLTGKNDYEQDYLLFIHQLLNDLNIYNSKSIIDETEKSQSFYCVDCIYQVKDIICNFESLQLKYQEPIKYIHMSRRFDHVVEFNKRYWNSIYILLQTQNMNSLESLYMYIYEENDLIKTEELFNEKNFPNMKECTIYVIESLFMTQSCEVLKNRAKESRISFVVNSFILE